MILLSFLFFGIAGRLRGQDLKIGDWFNHFVIWGGATGITTWLLTHNLIFALVSIPCAGFGCQLGYWGDNNMQNTANFNWSNYLKLTLTAMFRFTPLLIASFSPYIGVPWHVLPAVLGGVFMVPAYILALYVPQRVFFAIWMFHMDGYTEWAEFFFWGSIGAAYVAGFTL